MLFCRKGNMQLSNYKNFIPGINLSKNLNSTKFHLKSNKVERMNHAPEFLKEYKKRCLIVLIFLKPQITFCCFLAFAIPFWIFNFFAVFLVDYWLIFVCIITYYLYTDRKIDFTINICWSEEPVLSPQIRYNNDSIIIIISHQLNVQNESGVNGTVKIAHLLSQR